MAFRTWLQDNPGALLSVLVAVTILAVFMEAMSRRRRRRSLRQLAGTWGMTYSPTDRLRLLERIAERFPVAGAADLEVSDVIYGSDGERYRYVFTVRYTVGVIRGKRSLRRVAAFSEARQRRTVLSGEAGQMSMADEQLSLVEQYGSLDPTSAETKSRPQ
jgi:hypothetical protein